MFFAEIIKEKENFFNIKSISGQLLKSNLTLTDFKCFCLNQKDDFLFKVIANKKETYLTKNDDLTNMII